MQNKNTSGPWKSLYMLLAIVAAVSMWFFVDEFGYNGGPHPAKVTISDIPIHYNGEAGLAERGLMLLEEETSATLDLTIVGARRQVVQLQREDIRVSVNLIEVENAGVQTVDYRITFADRRFSESMITERSISDATVNISELHSKTVEIHCELSGNVAEGYSAGQLELSQETLEIRGEPDVIDPVAYAKVILDLGENTMETVSQELEFLYFDENHQPVSGYGIHPTVEHVTARLPVYVTKQLRLVMDFREAPGVRESNLVYEIKPKTITVSGDAGQLRNVDTIVLGEMDLLALRSSANYNYVYPIIIPEGCQNLSGVTQATLEIDFKDLSTATVAADQITYTNLPQGKRVEILTQELPVRIFGTSPDVDAVTKEHISAVANLNNYSAASGTYTVPAAVTVNAPGDVGVAGTYTVQVTIRDLEEPAPPETPPETQTPEDEAAGE